MLTEYNASTLLQLTEKEIWQLPEGYHAVVFDDGKRLKTLRLRTIISYYFWRLMREYNVPILREHHLGNGRFTKGTELDLAGKILWHVHDYVTKDAYDDDVIWEMSRITYEILNSIHNMSSVHLSEYVTSVDLSDIAGLITHPGIKKAKELLPSGTMNPEAAVKLAHSTVIDIVNSDDPSMRHNGVAMMARAKLLSLNQLVQFIGPRGFVFATDGSLFKHPIEVGYIDGMSALSDSMTESRSASSALYMNTRPLQLAEYFNRQMQLLTGVIKGVEGNDCQTPHTLSWLVDKNDIRSLHGKCHMVEGKPVVIRPDDRHLIGQVIKLRSMTCCQNHDTSTVCRVCLGETYKVLPPRTNLGHILTIEPLASISQLILSTKHVIASRASLFLEVNTTTALWLRLERTDKSSVKLRKQCASNRYIMRVGMSELFGLNNIHHCEDPGHLSPERISCISEIALAVADREGNRKGEWVYIPTVVGGKGSALSSEVILSIKENGTTLVDEFIEIPLIDFKSKELFITPRRNESMMEYLSTVKHFVFGSEKNGESIVSYNNTGLAVAALKRIFDEKIRVNMVHVEVFIKALMVINHYANDYRLPRGGDPFMFCPARAIISNRSVSAALAFQNQQALFMKPSTYLQGKPRPNHPLDAMFQHV